MLVFAQSSTSARWACGTGGTRFVDTVTPHISIDVIAGHQIWVVFAVFEWNSSASYMSRLGPYNLGEVTNHSRAAKGKQLWNICVNFHKINLAINHNNVDKNNW